MEAVGPVPDDEMIVVHGRASLRGVLDTGAGLFNVQAAVLDHFLREVDSDFYTKPDRHIQGRTPKPITVTVTECHVQEGSSHTSAVANIANPS